MKNSWNFKRTNIVALRFATLFSLIYLALTTLLGKDFTTLFLMIDEDKKLFLLEQNSLFLETIALIILTVLVFNLYINSKKIANERSLTDSDKRASHLFGVIFGIILVGSTLLAPKMIVVFSIYSFMVFLLSLVTSIEETDKIGFSITLNYIMSFSTVFLLIYSSVFSFISGLILFCLFIIIGLLLTTVFCYLVSIFQDKKLIEIWNWFIMNKEEKE